MHIFLQTNSQPISLKPAALMAFSFPLPIPVSIRLSLIGHWQYSWTYDRFLPVIRSVRLGWLCTRMEKSQTTDVPARNSAVLSANPNTVFVPATTKIGTTERKTGAAPNTECFLRTTGFPLTVPASTSREHTLCVQSVKDITPALRRPGRNDYGCATETVRQTSIRSPTSLPWLWPLPPFCPALTPTARLNHSGDPLNGCSCMALFARFSTGLAFYAFFLFAG